MKALICDNCHFFRDKNGNYFSNSVYNYAFFERYLKVFDEIKIIGKVRLLESSDNTNYMQVNGKGIDVVELPWYKGMKGMLKNLPRLIKIYRKICNDVDCCVFRVAQVESFLIYLLANIKRKPFAVEVVNDPETFDGTVVRNVSIFMTKRMCAKANGASYVTERFLQNKYPNCAMKKGENYLYFSSYYSSIQLCKEDLFSKCIEYKPNNVFQIIHIANAIDTDVKGHYTLFKAVAEVVKQNYKVEVTCIGDGSKVPEYKEFIESIGLSNVVKFIGRISNKKIIFDKLRNSNLLVLPTQMEGLPRVIIEAMSVGLPCISTPIAGIPELLDKQYLFDPFDSHSFALEIIRLINNLSELKKMSMKNLEKAKEFTNDVLEPRRTEFYGKLRNVVEYQK